MTSRTCCFDGGEFIEFRRARVPGGTPTARAARSRQRSRLTSRWVTLFATRFALRSATSRRRSGTRRVSAADTGQWSTSRGSTLRLVQGVQLVMTRPTEREAPGIDSTSRDPELGTELDCHTQSMPLVAVTPAALDLQALTQEVAGSRGGDGADRVVHRAGSRPQSGPTRLVPRLRGLRAAGRPGVEAHHSKKPVRRGRTRASACTTGPAGSRSARRA